MFLISLPHLTCISYIFLNLERHSFAIKWLNLTFNSGVYHE